MENHTPVDSEGEIFFRRQELAIADQAEHVHTTSPQRMPDDDDMSISSHISNEYIGATLHVEHQLGAVPRTLPLQRQGVNRDRTDQVLDNITGALKEVVSELKTLKQTIPQRGDPLPSNPQYANYRDCQNVNPQQSTNQGDFEMPPRHCRFVEPRQYQPFLYNGAEHRVSGRNENFNSAHPHDINIDEERYGRERLNVHRGDQWLDNGCYGNRRREAKVRTADRVKIPAFTGKEDWQVWVMRFDAIAARYGWDDEDRLDQLLPRIEGDAAQFLYGQLPKQVLANFGELVREMGNRFRVVETNRSFAAKFSRRNQKVGETVEEYAADLKMLYDKAHGYRDRRTREEDLVRRFLDGIRDDEVRFEVEFHKEPETIDDAVYHVVNFIPTRNSGGSDRRNRAARRATLEGNEDNICRVPDKESLAGKARKTNAAFHAVEITQSQEQSKQEEVLVKILERLEKLEKSSEATSAPRRLSGPQNKSLVECYKCHTLGHYARNCPQNGPQSINGQSQNRNWNGSKYQRNQGKNADLNCQGPALVTGKGSC